jgi:hypothetical protein
VIVETSVDVVKQALPVIGDRRGWVPAPAISSTSAANASAIERTLTFRFLLKAGLTPPNPWLPRTRRASFYLDQAQCDEANGLRDLRPAGVLG